VEDQREPELGTTVLHGGRAYVLRGFSRQSHSGAQFVHLEDKQTGDSIDLTWAELWGEDPQEPPPAH
jgi:hypothetical protein